MTQAALAIDPHDAVLEYKIVSFSKSRRLKCYMIIFRSLCRPFYVKMSAQALSQNSALLAGFSERDIEQILHIVKEELI